MKTINADQKINDLKGEVIEGVTVGSVVSSILASTKTSFDSMKAWLLAQRFYQEKQVLLDEADFEKLKQIINNNESYTPLVKGQILEIFSKV